MTTEMFCLTAALLLLAMAIILLIALLVRQRHLQEALDALREDGRASAQQTLADLDDTTDALVDGLEHQRQQTAATLQQMNTTLLTTLTQLGQSQSSLLESTQRQVLLSSRAQEERLEQLRQTLSAAMTDLRQENDRQLSDMRRTVDEKLTESLDKRLSESFAQVSQRLEQVYRGLGEMQSLAAGVGDLKKVLTNVKTRGIWGEMQLGRLLSEMLTPAQYAENIAVVPGSQERVEYAVRLPAQDGSAVYLPIDSKFPQESYLRLVDASQQADPVQIETSRKALAAAIRTEARRIGKYIRPPHTTDFAVMFLPVEGLYAEVMRDATLSESIQREQRVVIAGPSTFAALLNALQMGFRTLAIQQRSGEVWKLLGAVKADFSQFADVLQKTRQRLQQATDSIDTAFDRTQRIQKRLGQVEQLDMEALPDMTNEHRGG